jgi:hypothetical protein
MLVLTMDDIWWRMKYAQVIDYSQTHLGHFRCDQAKLCAVHQDGMAAL